MSNRLEELDGLRGIAAFMVFLSHVIGLMVVTKFVALYQNSPVQIISDGAAAVDIFFVLSGFVLSLPYIDKNKKLNYFSFVFKRIFRLYPTYWICIILTILIKNYFNQVTMHSLSEWAGGLWIRPINKDDIIRHIFLIIKTDYHVINPVVWTLAIEMKMSLVLPVFILWLKKWRGGQSQILLLLTSFLLSILTAKFEFLPLFVIGLILSKHWRYFEAIKDINYFKICALFLLSVIFIGNRCVLNFNNTPQFQSLLSAFGAVLLIFLAIWWAPMNKLLKNPGVDFLGKISFSFYLYHFPLLLVTVSILYPIYKSLIIPVIVSLLLTFFVSFISYLLIESKSMRLYRDLAGWISHRIG